MHPTARAPFTPTAAPANATTPIHSPSMQPSVTPPAATNTTLALGTSSDNGLASGAIAGAVIGIAGVAIIITAAVYYFWLRQQVVAHEHERIPRKRAEEVLEDEDVMNFDKSVFFSSCLWFQFNGSFC